MSPLVEPAPRALYGALPVARLTPDLRALVKTGAIYSLGVVHQEGIPGNQIRLTAEHAESAEILENLSELCGLRGEKCQAADE